MDWKNNAAKWLLCAAAAGITAPVLAGDWRYAGADLRNTRSQADERILGAGNVGALAVKWSIPTASDVVAAPATDGEFLYFPDAAGSLYKVNRSTGVIAWQKSISEYTGTPNNFARATPAIDGNALILGDQAGRIMCNGCSSAPPKVFAVDKRTGALLWRTQVDDSPTSFVTQSAIVSGGTVYVGIASNEELLSAFVPQMYWQWTFRGSVVALDARTGLIKWKTHTVPAGYAGGAIWGSTPALDRSSNTLYVATGNLYWAPVDAVDCVRTGGAPAKCLDPDAHFDSIVAINASTGRIKWGQRGLSYDAWSVACGLNIPGIFTVPPNPANCPALPGPDYDFAQGPMLFNDKDGTLLVGAGQKSGAFWAFKAGSGKLAWSTQVSPGGVTGGMQWGSATDGRRVYVTASNAGDTNAGGGAGAKPWALVGGGTTYGGGWAAMDPNTGAMLWTTPVPGAEYLTGPPGFPQGFRAEGAPAVANGVLYGCAQNGAKYAMNAASGQILWSQPAVQVPNQPFTFPCNAAPTVADGVVYWGSGNSAGFGLPGMTAYSIGGQ